MKTATAELQTRITRVENDAKADFLNQEKRKDVEDDARMSKSTGEEARVEHIYL